MPSFEKLSGSDQEEQEHFRSSLREEMSRPQSEWSNELKEYIQNRAEAWRQYRGREVSAEDEREYTYARYIRDLELREESLQGKRVLDVGCGEEGDFVRTVLEKGLTDEAYGMDIELDPQKLGEARDHFVKGNALAPYPLRDMDLIVSRMSFSFADSKSSAKRRTRIALDALKEGRELRFYPLQKPPPGSELEGLRESYEMWQKALKESAEEHGFSYGVKPIDVGFLANTDDPVQDSWLEELVVIRKVEREQVPESKKSEKEKVWEEKLKKIDFITDRRGKPIDEDIRETVAAFQLSGFNTSGSCEGHEEWGTFAPWVDLEPDKCPKEQFVGQKEVFRETAEKYGLSVEDIWNGIDPEQPHYDRQKAAWYEAYNKASENEETEEYKRWKREREELKRNVAELLDEFYRERDTDDAMKLAYDEKATWLRVHNGGESLWKRREDMSDEEVQRLKNELPRRQREMKDFAEFLKGKFLGGGE